MMYDVVVDLRSREIRTVMAESPQDAAAIVERDATLAYPELRVEVLQVDYHTANGGESHWYPKT